MREWRRQATYFLHQIKGYQLRWSLIFSILLFIYLRIRRYLIKRDACRIQIIKVKLLWLYVCLTRRILGGREIESSLLVMTWAPAPRTSRGPITFILLFKLLLVLTYIVLYLYFSLHFFFNDILNLQFVSILLFLKLLLNHLLDFHLLLVLLLLKLIHWAPRTSNLISSI